MPELRCTSPNRRTRKHAPHLLMEEEKEEAKKHVDAHMTTLGRLCVCLRGGRLVEALDGDSHVIDEQSWHEWI